MAKPPKFHPSDIHGLTRLARDATLGTTELVEAMHMAIARASELPGSPVHTAVRSIAGLVYGGIRGLTQVIGGGADALLGEVVPHLAAPDTSPEREAMLAALNGVLGDYLVDSGNPLAISMRVRQDGRSLELAKPSLAQSLPRAQRKLLLLVHGLCMNDRQWLRQGYDHGARLAADLGYTPLYLHYNTGLHISANGRAFADLIEALVSQWPAPVEHLAMVGHSMGGLVIRSACHYGLAAGQRWLDHLRTIVFLGTPHHGAPLERVGHWAHGLLAASPYTAALARLGTIRSAGITDLRYGSLLDEDWASRDRFGPSGDTRRSPPLPDGVRCAAVAATTGVAPSNLRDQIVGDGLVPLDSALGRHPNPSRVVPFPASGQMIGYGMNHLDLLNHPEVYAQLHRWLAA